MRHLTLAAGASIAVLMLAGCAGGSTSDPQAVKACMEERFPVSTDTDYVAQTADGFDANVNGNKVTLAFGGTAKDAARLEAAYKVFASAFDSPVDDILSRSGNVVVLWENTPSDSGKQAVADCL